MKNILVTGNLGFIGFNFVKYVTENYPQYKITGLDSETYAAKPWYYQKINYLSEHEIVQYPGNICNSPYVIEVIKRHEIDTIINFAAETHVDNSIEGPRVFTDTNFVGVSRLLEIVRKHDLRFHQIGTDEVYGSVDPDIDLVDENFQLKPSSPYSATKTSADLLTLSYFKTFGCKVTVSRCSNNFGPYQHTEKLIPKVICNAIEGKKIPVYGNGCQRRFWISVHEHNEAIMKILEYGRFGEVYNIAPNKNNLITNISLIRFILKEMNKDESLIEYVKDRPGHDLCYYLDGKKIQNECNFFPSNELQLKKDMKNTIDWYINTQKLL